MAVSPLTYLNFSDELHYLKKETDIEDISRFLKYMYRFQKDSYFFSDHLFFVVDYTKRKYSVIAGPFLQTISYHPRDLLDGGLDFLITILQKDDFAVINKKIFSSNATFFAASPHDDHNKYIFETNYRVHGKKGDFFSVLQKGSYITDAVTKLPLYGFGICINITAFKKDTSMVQVISRYNDNNRKSNYEHISTDYYYPDEEANLLTARETEILKWIAEGLSSKQIADKFKLSHNTIMNHRKNMLRKVNAKNVAELIKYSITNNLI